MEPPRIIEKVFFLTRIFFSRNSTLHAAATNGHLGLVKKALSSGTNIDCKNPSGMTALHCASKNGHLNIVKFLIDNKASIDLPNDGGYKIPQEVRCGTALLYAVNNKDLVTAQYLIQAGADVNFKHTAVGPPLHAAISNHDLKMVQLLIQNNADINLPSSRSPVLPPLFLAARKGYENIVEYLLKHEAKANGRNIVGNTPLHDASFKIMPLLIDNGADLNSKNRWGQTALYIACRQPLVENAKILISAGADVNLASDTGETPLHAVGSIKIAKLLLAAGADRSAKDNNGMTPILSAARGLRIDIVTYLMQNGSDIQATDNNGATILHWLAQKKFPRGSNILNLLNLDVNSQDKEGETPLCWAVHSDSIEYVKLLLKHNVDLSIRDKSGKTAIDIAGIKRRNKIEDLLRQ